MPSHECLNGEDGDTPAAAFLHAHPVRADQSDELPRVAYLLRDFWRVSVPAPSAVESDRAVRFYREKEMATPQVARWLR